MTNDQKREMLEAAARAARLNHLIWTPGASPLVPLEHRAVPDRCCWNPLEDDGDALRLAVRLAMTVRQEPSAVAAGWGAECLSGAPTSDGRGPWFWKEWLRDDQNPTAATRLAITRAAAEIGRQLKKASE